MTEPIIEAVEPRSVDWGKVVKLTTDVVLIGVMLWMLCPPLRIEVNARVAKLHAEMAKRKAERLAHGYMQFSLLQIREATPEQLGAAVKELAA